MSRHGTFFIYIRIAAGHFNRRYARFIFVPVWLVPPLTLFRGTCVRDRIVLSRCFVIKWKPEIGRAITHFRFIRLSRLFCT